MSVVIIFSHFLAKSCWACWWRLWMTVYAFLWKLNALFPRTVTWPCACVCVHASEGWQGTSAISSFWGLLADHCTGPPLWNVVILSWALLQSGCYFISTFCLRLNVNDALSAIYSCSSSLLQPYINIQHPSLPITHFRPGKIVTSFIGRILSQFPTAVCFHLWGSLSSSFHLSQHYSSGLPIKMIPIFITPENAGSRLSRKKKKLFFNTLRKRGSPQLTRRQDLAFTGILECVKLPEQSLRLHRDGNGDSQQSNAVQSRTLNFPFEQEEWLQMEHLLTHAPHTHKESYIYKELNLRAWNSLVTIWQRYT